MTNIIDGRADPVAGNAFQTIGGGAQGLSQLLAAAFAARDASKAAGVAQAQKDVAAMPPPALPGPASGSTTQNPWEAGGSQVGPLRASTSVDVNASAPQAQAMFSPMALQIQPQSSGAPSANPAPGGLMGGFLPQRFPQLFPKTASGEFQTFSYGGL